MLSPTTEQEPCQTGRPGHWSPCGAGVVISMCAPCKLDDGMDAGSIRIGVPLAIPGTR